MSRWPALEVSWRTWKLLVRVFKTVHTLPASATFVKTPRVHEQLPLITQRLQRGQQDEGLAWRQREALPLVLRERRRHVRQPRRLAVLKQARGPLHLVHLAPPPKMAVYSVSRPTMTIYRVSAALM